MMGLIINSISAGEGAAKKLIKIPIQLCHPDAKIPTYANIGDAGLDLYALDDYTINPGETRLIPTGIKVAIPRGYELQVRPKSGRALKTKLRVANTPGTIDAGYRDEVAVIIENVDTPIKDITYGFDENGNIIIKSILHGSPFYIEKGTKFAQLVLNETPTASFVEVQDIHEIEGDRNGGFGSS
jgi:dUTP pyrophosphatase